MNTDKKAKKEGFFLSVFICVHPWLNWFVRSRGSVRFLGGSGMPVTSGVRNLDPASKSACATKTDSSQIPRRQEFGVSVRQIEIPDRRLADKSTSPVLPCGLRTRQGFQKRLAHAIKDEPREHKTGQGHGRRKEAAQGAASGGTLPRRCLQARGAQ